MRGDAPEIKRRISDEENTLVQVSSDTGAADAPLGYPPGGTGSTCEGWKEPSALGRPFGDIPDVFAAGDDTEVE